MRTERSKRRIIISVIAGVLLIVLFGLGLYMIEKHGLLDEQFGDSGEWGKDEDIDTIYLTYDDEDYICTDDVDAYLIAGTDGGGKDLGDMYSGDQADFITVLVADNTTQKYAMYQLDRNTMVEMMIPNENGNVQDFYEQQLCLSHWYGRDDEERNGYLVAAVTDVMHGLEPTSYYVLNMADIGEVNDAFGGVEVTIDEDMTDMNPAFTKGSKIRLTGEQAEDYLRARMDVGEGTNAERMGRQRQYMQNAYTALISSLKENPEYINDIYDQLSGLMQTDEESDNLSKLTNQLIEYENLGILVFEGETRTADTQGDGVMHEEFYQDEQSALTEMSKVMNIEIDTSTDDEEE